MQIGYVTTETIKIDGENKNWTKMTLRMPFGRHQDFKIAAHKKDKESEPDFDIYLLVNNKGEKFRNPKVGALWLKTSERGERYMSGNIESPALSGGIAYIAITVARPLYDGEEITWTHDVLWSNPNGKKQSNRQESNVDGGDTRVTSFGDLSLEEINALLATEAAAVFR